MERSYSYDKNLDDFSKPLTEIYQKGIERRKSNTDNDAKQAVYCDENSIDQIHFNKNHKNDFYLDQTPDFYDNHKHKGRKSKSSEKARASSKKLNFNSSGNSQIHKSNTLNFSRDRDFYYNKTDIISEEDFNEFNENFDKEYPQSIKNPDSNAFEKEIKNINLEFDIDKDHIQKEKSCRLNQNSKNETNTKMRNDFILNFDPNDKNNNYTMKRMQTVQIIKEGILQKKSPWFHYNTRKIVLDSTPRIEYIDPVLNKVKVILSRLQKFFILFNCIV